MDFAFSFSSIEHNGLGRYGDALDPNGDLRDMELLSCVIRPGGPHANPDMLHCSTAGVAHERDKRHVCKDFSQRLQQPACMQVGQH